MDDLKILRVCLSKDLPLLANRDPQYIYFLYDKLIVFIGQNLYSNTYAIVESMPQNPVQGMLYFTLDGYVKIYTEYGITDIAQIESQDQIEILKQTGTTFFVNAEKRYLDLQRRIITLPYQNGTYELTVSVANNLILDEDTVIAFNTETNEFDIVGKREDYDLIFTSGYKGKDTKSASVNVTNNRITTDIKISSGFDNILKLTSDGLYAEVKDRVTKEEFEDWRIKFEDYKNNMDYYLDNLSEEIGGLDTEVSKDSITAKIQEAIENVYPEINTALEVFDNISEQFNGIERRSKQYTDEQFQTAYNDLRNRVSEVTNNPWDEF